jgi:hypothetical protein
MSARVTRTMLVGLILSLMSWGVLTRASADPGKGGKPVVITFTKWISGGSPTDAWLSGVVGGDVVGDFAGEALTIQPNTNPNITSITRLVAIYEIHDHTGSHSFTALIQGGENNQTGKALLDGTILGGWRRGTRVHVQFLQINDPAVCVSAGAPPGTSPCFQGTIRIPSDSQ